jgi:hypothetical protein
VLHDTILHVIFGSYYIMVIQHGMISLHIFLIGESEINYVNNYNNDGTSLFSNDDTYSYRNDTSNSTKLKISNGYENNFNGDSQFSSGKRICYWKLIHAEGHVLFPGSDHIETFAVFDRILL